MRFLKLLAIVTVLFFAVSFTITISPLAGFALALPVTVVSGFALFRPLPRLGLGSRVFAGAILIFVGLGIRSAFRSCALNQFCNEQQKAGKKGYSCASNEANYAGHIWDRRDAQGFMGATACIVIPWFADRYEQGQDWRSLAWWIHDHLPYSALFFFPRLAAFNITWHENPERRISSYIKPRGILTKPGMDNHDGDHSASYEGFPVLRQS